MFDVLRRHEVWVFLPLIVVVNFVFTYGIAWEILPRGLFSMGRFLLLAGTLFAFVFLLRGFDGIWYVVKPLLAWRKHIGWYLFAALISPALCVVFLLGLMLVRGEGLGPIEVKTEIITNPGFVVRLMVGSLAGELVWISYCLRQLETKTSAYVAGLIVGFFWALWWMPMVWVQLGVLPGLTFWLLIVAQCAVALTCAFLYAKTHSGVLVFILAVTFQCSIVAFPVNPVDASVGVFWAFAITFFAAITALFVLFGPRPLISSSGRAAPA